jgi:putative selenate reductase
MKLGEPDASGRRRPVPSGAAEVVLPADTVIVAIGQELEAGLLDGVELRRRRDGTLEVDPKTGETSIPGLFVGGDVVRGASSIIHAIADGRAVAEAIGARCGAALPPEPFLDKGARPPEVLAKKALQVLPQTVPVLPVSQRGGFAEVSSGLTPESAAAEASRCLDCDDLCSLCVTVCPNRAMQAYAAGPLTLSPASLVVRGGRLEPAGPAPFAVAQPVQILRIGDFCNDCGNCDTFCPTEGAPYRAKPTFWLDADAWRESRGDAFRLERQDGTVIVSARLGGRLHRLERRDGTAEYRSEQVRVRLSADPWAVLGWEPLGTLAEGERVDLSACATLVALLGAEPALPPAPPPGAGTGRNWAKERR